MAKTRRRRNVHRRKTKKHHRRHKTKRRVKRRRKTTRKKRGKGIGPSKMAKVGVAALAASEMMKQGSAVVSRQARTVQQQLRAADCNTIQKQGRQLIIPLHPDHGGTDEDFIAGMNELSHRRGQCKLNRKRGDTGRNKPTRNPNTGKPMSKKKYKQQQKRRRNQQRQEKAREKARERARTQRQQEADARAGRRQQQENTESTGTNYMENIGVGAAAVGAAGLVAREMGRGRPRVRNTRIVTRNDGSRALVRDDGSVIRELTPERR
jgi:Tfp pilus assembly protein PilP